MPKSFWNFHLLFLSLGIIFATLSWNALRKDLAPALRTGLLALAGIAAYLPHFMHAPLRPYMNDEFAHYLQAMNMFDDGKLFQANPIVDQAANYPCFETMVVALRHLTHLSTYQSGTLAIACLHAATVCLIFQIARGVTGTRTAALAALFYAASPQFSFVDSLLAYESLGLPLTVGAIALALQASRTTQVAQRGIYLGLCTFLTVTCIFAHHLSSYVLLFSLAVISIGWLLAPARGVTRGNSAPLIAMTAIASVFAVAWVQIRHAGTFKYLTIYLQNGWTTITDHLPGHHPKVQEFNGYVAVGATRKPLGTANNPIYEVLLTYAFVPASVVLFVIAVLSLRRRWSAHTVLLLTLATMYFLSLPLLFSQSGQSAAHRSWAFTYVGLVVVWAIGAAAVAKKVSQWRMPALGSAGTLRAVGAATVVAFLIASYGAGINRYELFPGPFLFGSDGRNVPNELYGLATWFKTEVPAKSVIASDARTTTLICGEADMLRDGKQAAALILPPGMPTGHIIKDFRKKIDYVVVDNRLITTPSQQGYYFDKYEAYVPQPLQPSSITKLADVGWLTNVKQTEHYTVYKVVKI